MGPSEISILNVMTRRKNIVAGMKARKRNRATPFPKMRTLDALFLV